MSPLVWIAMPIGSTVIATLWAMWISRDRGPGDVTDSVQAHQRFVETLSKNVKPLPDPPDDPP
jgi:hypothetical protein